MKARKVKKSNDQLSAKKLVEKFESNKAYYQLDVLNIVLSGLRNKTVNLSKILAL